MQSEDHRNTLVSYNSESKCSMRDILSVLFRHKLKIIGFFVTVVVTVTVFTYVAPEIYESNAKLLLEVVRKNVAIDSSVVVTSIGLSQSRKNEVNSEIAIIESRFIVEKIVDKLGAESILRRPDEEHSELPVKKKQDSVGRVVRQLKQIVHRLSSAMRQKPTITPRERAIKMLMKNLNIEADSNSHITNLSFRGQRPELTRDVLDNLIYFYKEVHIKIHQSQISPKFFNERFTYLFSELEKNENLLKRYREKYGITSMDLQKQKYFEQISNFQTNIDDAKSQINASQAKILWLERNLQERSPITEINRVTGKTNIAAVRIKESLIDLRLREADLVARYPDSSRILIDLRKQIKLAEKELDKEEETLTEITTGIDTNYKTLQLTLETAQAQLQAQIARIQSMKEEMKERKTELVTLLDHEIVFTRLQRDVEIAAENYSQYHNSLKQSKISAALDRDKVSNVKIVQPPTLPILPIKPNKRLNIALSILLGLFGSIGFAFILETFDDSLRINKDVNRRLALPVLATVPYKRIEST